MNRHKGYRAPFEFLWPWIILFRVVPCSMTGLLGVVGYEARSPSGPVSSFRLLGVFAFIFLACASANIINDIRDFRTDSIQHPGRPLPSGAIGAFAAWAAFFCAAGAASGLASFFGWHAVLAISCLMAMGVFYSIWLKGTVLLGNAIVACAIGLALPIGAIARDAPSAATFLAGGLVALFMFSFEILKTIRDRKGDEVAGYRTVAVIYGERTSMLALRVCASSLAAVLLLLMSLQTTWPWTLVLLVCAVLPWIIVMYRLPLSPTAKNIVFALRGMGIAWIPGMLTIGVWLWKVRGS
jgi:geranylgeranylglycerol-phosphate geranylgeranyltransferase